MAQSSSLDGETPTPTTTPVPVPVPVPDGHDPPRRTRHVADELRRTIVGGELDEGESLGRESDLIERFGMSRPSLREALRTLEAEGLISVVRGALGGVVVHRPDQRMTARTAALVLQSRNVSLADVFAARSILEPAAAREIAAARGHRRSAERLRALIAEQRRALDDSAAFATAEARFHAELVALAGNQTLTIVAEMLDEVLIRAVTDVVDRVRSAPVATLRRAVRSKERLVALIEAGDAEGAHAHWRTHMVVVRRLMLGQQAKAVIDMTAHL